MAQRLKSVGVMSVAKTATVLYAGIGLIAGAVVWLITMAAPDLFTSSSIVGGKALFGLAGGAVVLIVLPVVYGCVGFVIGLVASWLYNMVARITGGIEVSLE